MTGSQLKRGWRHSHSIRPNFWGRYVDDTGMLTKKIHVQALFDHINQQHKCISPLKKREKMGHGQCSMSEWSERWRISWRIYIERRHPWATTYSVPHIIRHLKSSVPSSLFCRCETVIIEEEKKQVEMEKIKKDLRICGFHEWAHRQVKQQEQRRERKLKEVTRSQRRRRNMSWSHTAGVCLRDWWGCTRDMGLACTPCWGSH